MARLHLPSWLRRLLGEPLIQFMLAGLVFYALGQSVGRLNEEQHAKTITITQPALLEFIQYRSRNFDATIAQQRLDTMSDAQRRVLIDDFVREEVLYREAQALGLAQTDYVIRRRLVQKLNFITEGIIQNHAPPSRAEIEAYYATNAQDYAEPDRFTFSHIFFDNELHGGAEGALGQARQYLQTMRGLGFSDAVGRGDRFAFETNYVGRAQPDILASFGTNFITQLATMPLEHWAGPIASPYGAHLVFIAQHTPAYQPDLEAIYDVVAQDTSMALRRQRQDETIQLMIDGYNVRVALD